MNWTKVILGALVAGIVLSVTGFVTHGLIMAGTYARYDQVFNQEQAPVPFFFLVSIVILIPASVIFAKTRSAWPAGIGGGAQFGLLVGLTIGFVNFFWPMVFDGFPYYLAWCWLGIDAINYTIAGAVLATVIKSAR